MESGARLVEREIESPENRATVIIGASGGIGSALVRHCLDDPECGVIFAVSRKQPANADESVGRLHRLVCDHTQEGVNKVVAEVLASGLRLHRIVICTGMLHNEQFSPEKSLDKLDPNALREVFDVNVVVPALWIAALVRPLRRATGCVIAVLSARVGSITDNRLGGWYSYRTSKAALNMYLKSAAIEYARRAPGVKLVAFHPGTTDTGLSAPFQANVPPGKLFSADYVADRLMSVLDGVKPDGSLSFLDWAGIEIPW